MRSNAYTVWAGGVVMACGLAGGAGPVFAKDDVERENLTDIREIAVRVEEISPDAEAQGLTQRLLEDAVEERLAERGIPVGRSRRGAELYINVTTHEGSTGLYAYCVRVSVQQLVTIEGNRLRSLVDTWDRAGLGTVGGANLAEVEQVVLQIVDVFAEDYLEVNDPPSSDARQ